MKMVTLRKGRDSTVFRRRGKIEILSKEIFSASLLHLVETVSSLRSKVILCTVRYSFEEQAPIALM